MLDMAKSAAKGPIVEPLACVYALAGADAFLQRQYLTQILDAAGADAQRSDIDGDKAEPAGVFDELRSVAMFGGRRVVVIRDAEVFISRHRDAVEAYLGSPTTENVLVLRCSSLPKNQKVYKLASKAGQVVACDAPKAGELPRWLIERAKSVHDLKLSRDAAMLLADLIGVDLGSLDNELAKLAIRVGPGNEARPEHVADDVTFRREQQMWTLTDALTQGNSAGALRTWRQLVATDDSAEFRAVTWLGLWLEKASKAFELRRNGWRPFDIAKELRIWPAQNVDPLLRTAESLGAKGLRDATDRLAEADYRIKTGLGDPARTVETFIANASIAR